VRVDLDDGEVGELVDADDASLQDAAVVEGDLDLRGSVDDVVVGDDVAVRRDDDAAADAVLKLRLLRGLHLLTTLSAGAAEAEELGEAGRQTLRSLLGALVVHAFGGILLGRLGGDGDVDDGGGDAGGECLHGVVGGGEGGYAVVVERRGGDHVGVDVAGVEEEGCAEDGDGGRCGGDREFAGGCN
jgi:hypothetical protein